LRGKKDISASSLRAFILLGLSRPSRKKRERGIGNRAYSFSVLFKKEARAPFHKSKFFGRGEKKEEGACLAPKLRRRLKSEKAAQQKFPLNERRMITEREEKGGRGGEHRVMLGEYISSSAEAFTLWKSEPRPERGGEFSH